VREVTIRQASSPPPASATSKVVAKALPSLVNVRVSGLSTGGGSQKAEGSGVIIDPNGIIITNNHVVTGALNVKVVFADGKHDPVAGRVIGTAPEKDLAVIKVNAANLRAITVGRSDELALGDDVIALGYPLGLGGPTVTKGILSGKGRNITVGGGVEGSERLEDALQTDAAINPGNSGGPLVDSAGELIGINTAAASAGTAENIGFAIAIDSALPIVKEIIQDPPAKRAWLGVSIAEITSSGDAVQLGVDPDVRGVAIVDTFEGGPARRAGVEAGEVITALNGDAIRSESDLTTALADLDPGETATLHLVGRSDERDVDVKLGVRPVTLNG
jgi:S1-C subfamily serine protease